MRTLYVDQVGGASGDMFLGLLVALGVDPKGMENALARLGVGEIRIEASAVQKGGFPATHVRVVTAERGGAAAGHHHDAPHDAAKGPHHHGPETASGEPETAHHHPHRAYSTIVRLIGDSGLPGPVIEKSIAVFRRLGEVEARIHGVPLEEIHFHEVGALDAIADIVGTVWGLHALGVERLLSSPFLLGRSLVRMAHGTWPVPAPAVLELIAGRPARLTDLDGETVTPTGAALIVTLAHAVGGEWPLTVNRSAAGAGSRDWPGRPNVLRGFLGETAGDAESDAVEVLEAAIDDMTPEAAAWLARRLLESGALDVITIPIIMKKGRPGFQMTVLAESGRGAEAAAVLFRESSTLGIRHRTEARWILERRLVTVPTEWGVVAVKVARLPGGGTRISPEFEDCARLARERGIPLLDVMDAARRAAAGSTTDLEK